MKLDKMLTPSIKALVVLFAAQAAFADDGTWLKRDGVGTSLESPADWFDPENWVDGVIPSGAGAKATLDDKTTGAANQYIAITNDVTLSEFYAPGTTTFIGEGRVTIVGSTAHANKDGFFWAGKYYIPISFTPSYLYSRFHGDICGPFDCSRSLWFAGELNFRLDRWASDTNPVRITPIGDGNGSVLSQAHLTIYCPEGLDAAATSTWSTTDGSTFVRRAAGTVKEHALPVGTLVTGVGVPDGTFLRRIFDDDTIELSQPLTNTVASAELTFAAFAPDVTQQFQSWQPYLNSYYKIQTAKYREQDRLRVKVTGLNHTASCVSYALDTPAGWLPGIVEVGNVNNVDKAVNLRLGTSIMEFAPHPSGINPLGLPVSTVFVESATAVATVVVTNNLSASIGTLSQVKGTFVKDGAGALSVGFPSNAPSAFTGSIVVKAGTLGVASFAESTNHVATLSVKAGATFEVPSEGFSCDLLDVEDGSVIGGSGVLTYRTLAGGTMPAIVVKGTAVVRAEAPEEEGFSFRVLNGAYTAYTKDGDDVLVFDSSATIAVAGTGTVSMLVVGGGGGGGQYRGGGGGGGGVIETNDVVVTPGVYALTVGEGGAAAVGSASGQNGEASTAFGVTALGGGGGGTQKVGADGGSGGGGGAPGYGNYATNSFGLGTAGQGFEGSAGVAQGSHWSAAGGGGGGAGQPALPYRLNSANRGVGGRGGDGKFSSIWVPQYYGGGGNGGSATADYEYSRAGRGGGGKAGAVNASNVVIANGEPGVDGLGGGGGGGGDFVSTHAPAGRGGRGTIILRLANPHGDYVLPEREGCATGGDLVRYRKRHWIHTFTNDASFVLMQDVFADVLLVGGGGGGGSSSGGGGGGGAVVAITNLYLPAGTYPIVIGKGGIGCYGGGGIATGGTPTTLTQQNGTISLQALGGGAGGTRKPGGNGGPGGGGGAGYYYNDMNPGYAGGDDVLGPCPSGGNSTNVLSSVWNS